MFCTITTWLVEKQIPAEHSITINKNAPPKTCPRSNAVVHEVFTIIGALIIIISRLTVVSRAANTAERTPQ